MTTKPGEVYVAGMGASGNKNVSVSVFDTPGAFAALSPQAQQKLYRDATSVYGHDKVPTINMDSFLANTAYNAYAVQQSTGLAVDPLSYWDYYRQTGGPGLDLQRRAQEAGGMGGGGGGSSRSTNISRSVDISNPTEARSLADQALSRYLGRRANDQEYEAFTQALNRAQRKAPRVSRSTSVVSRGGGGTTAMTDSVTKGGVDAARFAEEWALSQEGAAEYAAATTVLDSFMKILGD